MNKKISFPIAIIIILVCAILVGGLVAWQYFSIPEIEIPLFTPSEKPPEDETVNWKTYRNEGYGFEIKYPPNWIITNDTLPKTPRNTVARQNLEIANNLVPEFPKLILWANPLGWGPTPFDIKYELSPTEENGIKVITRTEIPQYEESEEGSNIDGQVVIFCKTVKLGANTYTFSFIFKEGGKDYEPILNQMLSTFRFLE